MANRPITEKEKLAWEFAKEKHKGQKRAFTGLSYFDEHVQKVNGLIKIYTKNEDILCAALLHDVIEDCYDNKWEGYKEIKALFGKKIADIVMELTSDKDEIDIKYDGSKTDYLIHKLLNMSNAALEVKIADRFMNISDAFTASAKFRNKYFEETSRIIEELEANRRLNRIHKLLVGEIKGKLSNISSIFKIKRFKDVI